MLFRSLLFLYLVSLFYNIPIANLGNEIKLYDPLFLYFIYHFLNNREGIRFFANADAASRAMIKFGLWCSFTFVITCCWMLVTSNFFVIFNSGLYLIHLWGFIITAIFFRKDFLLDRKFLENTIFVLSLIAIAECLIIIGQNLEVVPYLWSDVYFTAYGADALTGTLGPNRVVPGTAMFLMFVLSISVLLSKHTLSKIKLAAYFLIILSIVVLLQSGSRTGYISLFAFIVMLTILSPLKVLRIAIPSVLLLAILLSIFNTSTIQKDIVEMFEYRVLDQVEQTDKYASDEGDYYGTLGAGRYGKLARAAEFIGMNPWIIPVGSGFNNHYSGATNVGNSVHNLYLTMIIENGIVGLVLYFFMLFSFIRGRFWDKQNIVLIALFIGVLTNMFFGENFYIYRPCYGLLGLLLIVLSIIDVKRFDTEVSANGDK